MAGKRAQYRPLATALCASSDPVAVLRAYLNLAPFTVFYLADLNAIQHQDIAANRAQIDRLRQSFPQPEWWLDSGFQHPGQLAGLPPKTRPVLGSESQTDIAAFSNLLDAARAHAPLLSLDFKEGRFLGPAELLDEPRRWPRDVIVMQLDRVGVDRGPDTVGVRSAGDKRLRRQLYAAGGVRDNADLKRLAGAGFSGVLVASALHDGRLTPAELADYC